MKLISSSRLSDPMRSPPARGRGLKPVLPIARRNGMESPPARGRGLKQGLGVIGRRGV